MDILASHLPDDEGLFSYFKDSASRVKAVLDGTMELPSSSWKGYDFIPICSASIAKYAYENVDYPEDAVFIVTFPKTGTNWTLEIIRQILYGHEKKYDELSKLVQPGLLFLSMGTEITFDMYKRFQLPRYMYCSHLPEELFNVEKVKKSKGKIIYCMRNPKDQAVSLFHFLQEPMYNVIREHVPNNWNEFFQTYIQGNIPLITRKGEAYLDHLKGWYKHKDDKDVLFLQFEDRKKDLESEIRKIAEFLEVDIDDRIDSISRSSQFDFMKKATGSDHLMGLVRDQSRLMRKGAVGNWKETFTVEQSEQMDQLVEEKLKNLNIKFTYE